MARVGDGYFSYDTPEEDLSRHSKLLKVGRELFVCLYLSIPLRYLMRATE